MKNTCMDEIPDLFNDCNTIFNYNYNKSYDKRIPRKKKKKLLREAIKITCHELNVSTKSIATYYSKSQGVKKVAIYDKISREVLFLFSLNH